MRDEPAATEAELPLHRHLDVLLPYLRPAKGLAPQAPPATVAAAVVTATARAGAVAALAWLSPPVAPMLRLPMCRAIRSEVRRTSNFCANQIGAPVPLRLLTTLFDQAEARSSDPYVGNALALLPAAEGGGAGLILFADGTNMDTLTLRSAAPNTKSKPPLARRRPGCRGARLQQVCAIAAQNADSAGVCWLAAARSAYSVHFLHIDAEGADADGAVAPMARACFGKMLTHVCLNPRQASNLLPLPQPPPTAMQILSPSLTLSSSYAHHRPKYALSTALVTQSLSLPPPLHKRHRSWNSYDGLRNAFVSSPAPLFLQPSSPLVPQSTRCSALTLTPPSLLLSSSSAFLSTLPPVGYAGRRLPYLRAARPLCCTSSMMPLSRAMRRTARIESRHRYHGHPAQWASAAGPRLSLGNIRDYFTR